MADAELTFDDKAVNKLVKGLQRNLRMMSKDKSRDFVRVIQAVTFKDIVNHFEREQGPDGNWKPWSSSYRAFMQSLGKGGNKILQDTGRLKQSLLPANIVHRPIKDGILWFSRVPYSGIHDRGRGNIPQRRFMWISERGVSDIEEQTAKFMLRKL